MHDFLGGIRVLDLSQYLPGPFAARVLGDMGADVVKVEPPSGDPLRVLKEEKRPTLSPYYEIVNAGKRVICLDLKEKSGREQFSALIRSADVLLESFRPDVLERLGFGADRLKTLNPGLIHCALSGYGQTGPWRLASGHDLNYMAMAGTLSATGTRETPVMTFPPLADHAGAMQAAVSVLGALMARSRHGQGCFIDISITESLLYWQELGILVRPERGKGLVNGGAAAYQVYRTEDDKFVSLSALEPKFWENFCLAVDRRDWIDRRFDELPQTGLRDELQNLFATAPRDHWDSVLDGADCCYQAVLDYEEVMDHPHIQARGFVHAWHQQTEVLFPAIVDGEQPEARQEVQDVAVENVLASWRAPGL